MPPSFHTMYVGDDEKADTKTLPNFEEKILKVQDLEHAGAYSYPYPYW